MAGVKGALIGSLWLMLSIIPLSIILGIGTAISSRICEKQQIYSVC